MLAWVFVENNFYFHKKFIKGVFLMQIFIVAIVLILAGLTIIFTGSLKKQVKNSVPLGIVVCVIGGILFVKSCIFQVDEGEALVKTAFKKISGSLVQPGINLKWPWENVHSFPTRLEAYTDKIPARSQDGMAISIDLTTHYKVDAENIENIYRNTAKNLKDLNEKIIYPTLRKTIRDSIATLGVKEVYSKRGDLNNRITEDAKKALEGKHVIIDKVLLRAIELPKEVEEEIQVKIRSQQQAEAMEYKKLVSEKESEIKAIEARGVAEAQRIINRTLTPLYLQHEAIEAYKKLATSSNSTFIVMPTSTQGTGLPLILNAK